MINNKTFKKKGITGAPENKATAPAATKPKPQPQTKAEAKGVEDKAPDPVVKRMVQGDNHVGQRFIAVALKSGSRVHFTEDNSDKILSKGQCFAGAEPFELDGGELLIVHLRDGFSKLPRSISNPISDGGAFPLENGIMGEELILNSFFQATMLYLPIAHEGIVPMTVLSGISPALGVSEGILGLWVAADSDNAVLFDPTAKIVKPDSDARVIIITSPKSKTDGNEEKATA